MKTKKGIRRVDCERSRTKGWYVTIKRASGESVRLFSDGIYGGRQVSYRAACAWYDKMAAAYPLLSRAERMSIVRNNNRTGVAGVFRWPANGRVIPGAYWGVQWVEVSGQSPTRRKFSVALYGERKAKTLAIETRVDAIHKLSGWAGSSSAFLA